MKSSRISLLLIAVAIAGVAVGTLAGRWSMRAATEPANTPIRLAEGSRSGERPVLYWYDPMHPQHRFDRPGKSPFMDMALVPRYADQADDGDGKGGREAGVKIDPAVTQNIGMRLATAERIPLLTRIEASGIIGLDERAVAVVQSRAAGFVERVWPLAPGDVIAAGQPLAELLVPAWAAAQHEFIAVRRSGDAGLLAAARERLRLLGMPDDLIGALEASGAIQARYRVRAPIAGMVQSLEVRAGMTLGAGQTLARLNGLDPVWLEVAVPEALAGQIAAGSEAQVQFTGLPAGTISGRVSAVLPTLDAATRSLRVRVELPNADGTVRPGQSAQVRLVASGEETALAVPTEAVIRTGRRALVMVAQAGGRYMPQEVTLGPELGDRTVIREGLAEGQQVVASGQFLLDSEASLLGFGTRPPAGQPATPPGEATP